MSTTGDPQDEAEALDDDKVNDRDDYGGDAPLDYPPDRPLGVNENPVEPFAPESVADSARREVPDPLVAALEREAADREGPVRSAAERLLDDLEVDVPDDDGELDDVDRLVLAEDGTAVDELVAEFDDEGAQVAELIDPTPGYDDEEQAVAFEGGDTGEATAEEAAMHIEHER